MTESKPSKLHVWVIKALLLIAVISILIYLCFSPEQMEKEAIIFLTWLSEHRFLGPLSLFVILTVT